MTVDGDEQSNGMVNLRRVQYGSAVHGNGAGKSIGTAFYPALGPDREDRSGWSREMNERQDGHGEEPALAAGALKTLDKGKVSMDKVMTRMAWSADVPQTLVSKMSHLTTKTFRMVVAALFASVLLSGNAIRAEENTASNGKPAAAASEIVRAGESPAHGVRSVTAGNIWQEAFASGNGRMGALLFGTPAMGTCAITHCRLYRPFPSLIPDIASNLMTEITIKGMRCKIRRQTCLNKAKAD